MADLRGAPRCAPGVRALSEKARLRHGPEVTVVDCSTGGVLIEGPCRLRPGGMVDICLDLSGREAAHRCRVVRCYVSAVHGLEGVCYRAALRFEVPPALGAPSGPDG